ncbi:MAG: DUF853 family protein [Blautia sp.]|nr:DUF853 family protein [Blautia sp.]
MYQDNKILIGKSGEENIYIYPKMANRHGLIAGATGSGKTITLKVLAESFSDCGVPVFLADAKGDLAGMCRPGQEGTTASERVEKMGLAQLGFTFKGYPTIYWDVYQNQGLPLRTTISEMGPLLLSRILGLNDTQSDILTVVFKIADDESLLLVDTKDLKAMISYVGERAKEYALQYGNIAHQSLAAITRSIVALEAEGGEMFFGEPALSIRDWISTDNNGRGKIHVLACEKLMQNPTMYATFMMWMLSELYEMLPEAGDMEKPRIVFFFDEAHMLFDNASKSFLSKVEQVVKLIRSKGVGIYFITQNPSDIPDGVLGQLGNKVQHALHAYTPKEQRAAKAASESFRTNEAFSTYDAILALGIGEALVSVLDEEGIPTIVKQTKILPPQSLMGALDDEVRKQEIQNCDLYMKYSDFYDRDSAYEFLLRKAADDARALEEMKAAQEAEKERLRQEKEAMKAEQEALKEQERQERAAQREREKEIAAAEKVAAAKEKQLMNEMKKVSSSAAGTLGRTVGNAIGKTVGGSFGKKLGGNVGAQLGRGIMNTLFSFRK